MKKPLCTFKNGDIVAIEEKALTFDGEKDVIRNYMIIDNDHSITDVKLEQYGGACTIERHYGKREEAELVLAAHVPDRKAYIFPQPKPRNRILDLLNSE